MVETPPPKENENPPPVAEAATPTPTPSEEDAKKWGTHLMGNPSVPTEHPDNQKAALWNAGDQQQPYLIYSPVDKPTTGNILEPVIHMFSSWSYKAETIARNIWNNLKIGPSVTGAAWGKVNLTFKALTEGGAGLGGFESLYKQIFATDPNEKLKKTFACYLSTATGPVAGTLYLSTAHVAFCSDRPLTFTAPSGQEAWSYYKVMIPLGNVGTVNPEIKGENLSEKYIHIGTIDGHDFWFMGFVSFEKASHHLLNGASDFRAHGNAAPPVSG